MSRKRPSATVADAISLIQDHYGLYAFEVKELISFDSRNFAIVARTLASEDDDERRKKCESDLQELGGTRPCESSRSECELCCFDSCRHTSNVHQHFVLKVFNSALSSTDTLPATKKKIQSSMFLKQNGFLCPDIVYTTAGDMFAHDPQRDRLFHIYFL
jgi:hypothetical protein